jgi:RES domain-containing protein
MLAWRVCKSSETNDWSGQGAALFGGRWNHPEQPMVYLGLSAAGCALDVLVQCANLPRTGFKLIRLQLPENPALYWQPSIEQLPPGWDAIPADRPGMDFGSAWLARTEHLGLIVPSATLTHTRNLLLNPHHPAASQVQVLELSDFCLG